MRWLLEHGLRAVIVAEAAAVIGASPRERPKTRMTWRNGSRPKTLTTAAGMFRCRFQTRTRSFFPAPLEPRRRIHRALQVASNELLHLPKPRLTVEW